MDEDNIEITLLEDVDSDYIPDSDDNNDEDDEEFNDEDINLGILDVIHNEPPDDRRTSSLPVSQGLGLADLAVNEVALNIIEATDAVEDGAAQLVGEELLHEIDDDNARDTDTPRVPKHRERKRLREEDQRERNCRKTLRNSGQEYTSVNKKVVPAVSFKNVPCECRNICHEKINGEQRSTAFKQFWNMGDFSKQNAYLCGLVKREAIKHRRPRNNTRAERTGANMYYLNIGSVSIKVCKEYLLKTFAVSNGRLSRAVKKEILGKPPGEDLRGKVSSVNKTPEHLLEEAREHINSFPAYQSHYTRSHNPNRKYLPSHLNLTRMYSIFEANAKEENRQIISIQRYRTLFRTMNLHFHVPAKDTCQKCDRYKMKVSVEVNPNEKLKLETDHKLHLCKAQKARDTLKSDAEIAKRDQNVHVLTFDLQKALAFPQLSVSIAYYKRNMYCYNLGVHDMGKGTGIMYVWDETQGSRGSQEIAACLVKHINLYASDKKRIIAYSDSCTGQNRNIKMALTWMKLVSNPDIEAEVIEHKFLQYGHSYLPNDSDFGNIETAAKNQKIFVPEDWYEIMRTARRKNKFLVNRMVQKDFLSTSSLESAITRRTKNNRQGQVRWLQIQWMRFERSRPYEMLYKETLNEEIEFEVLNLKPIKDRVRNIEVIAQPALYPKNRCVPCVKKADMMDLLPFIPQCNHQYFTDLRTNRNEDVGPLSDHADEDLESDVE